MGDRLNSNTGKESGGIVSLLYLFEFHVVFILSAHTCLEMIINLFLEKRITELNVWLCSAQSHNIDAEREEEKR